MHVRYHDSIPGVKCGTTSYLVGMDSLQNYIRARRETLGLTVTRLAELADLSKSEISAIENGRIALPGADKRRRLAHALGVRHIDLIVAAGELRPDEVPGPSPITPLRDPERAQLVAILDRLDLSVDNRAETLLGLLRMLAEQDRQRAAPPAVALGETPG